MSAQPVPLDPLEFQVNTYTWLWQNRPAVAVDPQGAFLVVWNSSGNDAGRDFLSIRARRFRPDGTPGEPRDFQVNSYSTYGLNLPAAAVDALGNFVVVWQSDGSFGSDGDGYSIQARRYSVAGAPLDARELQVNTYGYSWQQRPAVAADPRGNFVVVWDSWGSAGTDQLAYSVQGRRFTAGGGPLDPGDFQVNTYITNSQHYPAVAMAAGGGFVIVWKSGQSAQTNRSSIQARRYDQDGSPLDATEFRVDSDDQGTVWRPAVAAAPDGTFVVAWENAAFGGSEYRIRVRRFGRDGTPLDPAEFQVNSYTTSRREHVAVAMNAEGAFVVAWDSYGSWGNDTSRRSIQARRYRPDGTPADAAEFQVNSYTTEDQRRPKVAVTAEGDFVVAWMSYGSYGNDNDPRYSSIQARRFGRPTIEVTSESGGVGGPGCTLRDAVIAANTNLPVGECPAGNEGAVVELPAASSIALGEVDNGSNGLPLIERPVTILGHGSRIERDPGLACPVGPEFRLFEVADGGVLTLDDVSVSNGCLSSGVGGGVLSSGGSVVLRKASIEGNEAGSDGGGVALVGGNLLAFDSSVRGNLSGGAGGGLSVSGDPGWLLLHRVTISENAAASGGGLSLASATPAWALDSTFSANEATGGGGGIDLEGASSSLTLDSSTVAGNASPSGAGVLVGSGVLSVHGSLVGESSGGADCASGAGGVVASGANLDTDGSCAALAGGGVTTVASFDLGPLADNGGWVRTHLPLPGSPVLDAAPACATASGAPLVVDARGYPRPTDDDGNGTPACELGAVERGPLFLDGFESGGAGRWSLSLP